MSAEKATGEVSGANDGSSRLSDEGWQFDIDWATGITDGNLQSVDCRANEDSDLLELHLGNSVSVFADGAVFIQHAEFRPVKNRGDFRRLCEVLGIDFRAE